MFSDFLGINKTYNMGGQANESNWKLRVGNDYEDDYYRALQDENSYALNMPEILGQAVRAKSGMEVAKISYDQNKANSMRNDLNNKLNPLLGKLDKFKNILKEKEPKQNKMNKVKQKQVKTQKKIENKNVSNPIETNTKKEVKQEKVKA